MADTTKSRFELIVELIKAVTWPLIALVALITVHRPLLDVLHQLPQMVASSSKLTVGSVSIELDRKARAQATPELREAIANLSSAAIRKLFDSGDKTFDQNTREPYWPKEAPVWEELAAHNLVTITHQPPNQRGDDVVITPTDLGRRAYLLITDVMLELLAPGSDAHAEHESPAQKHSDATPAAIPAAPAVPPVKFEAIVPAAEQADTKLVQAYINAARMREAQQRIIEATKAALSGSFGALPPEKARAVEGYISANMSFDRTLPQRTQLIQQIYTRDELQQAIKFKESAVGRSLAEKDKIYARQMMELLKPAMNDLPRFIADVMR